MLLGKFGAVSSTFAPGDRKERFVAEIRLRKLVSGFLREQADPHLEKGVARLKQIEGLLEGSGSKDSRIRGTRRHEILSVWHRQMSRLLPWVKMIVGKSDRLPKKTKINQARISTIPIGFACRKQKLIIKALGIYNKNLLKLQIVILSKVHIYHINMIFIYNLNWVRCLQGY